MTPALLFDLDGTLLDSDAIHRQVFVEMMAPRGLEVTPEFYMRHIHGRLNVDFFAEFLPDEPDPQALSDAKEAQFRDRLPRPYPAMHGAKALIDRAVAEDWPRAIVTNAMRLNAEAMLEATGLRGAFDVIVIGEECSQGKPSPEPYLEAMRQLGVPASRCIAFEDSPSGLRAAIASGALTIGIRSALGAETITGIGAQASIRDFTDPALGEILARFTEKANP